VEHLDWDGARRKWWTGRLHYPAESVISPLTNVRRERRLPAPGEIVVRKGDEVEPTQVVGRAQMPSQFRILPVARLMGVSVKKAEQALLVKPGDVLRRGEPVARLSRLLSAPVKSPMEGVVTASGGGRLLIEAQPSIFELRAFIRGTVSNVYHGDKVVIETTGALIQGLWGGGGEGNGVLKSVLKGPEELLMVEQIDATCHGTIIIGGRGFEDGVLERAQQLQVRGIVTGGIEPRFIPQVEKAPFPIVVTEAIAGVPMSTPVFRLLTTNEGRDASISGHVRSRWNPVRPEIIIPLPAEAVPVSAVQAGAQLGVGTRVRVVRAPYAGAVGTVVRLLYEPQRIETGAEVAVAEVDLGQERTAVVPLANLEILR
jgi:hypothetical protein